MRITVGKSGSQSAYSLVEVVVAAGVAGIMFAALLGGLTTGFSSVQLDRENSRADARWHDGCDGLKGKRFRVSHDSSPMHTSPGRIWNEMRTTNARAGC